MVVTMAPMVLDVEVEATRRFYRTRPLVGMGEPTYFYADNFRQVVSRMRDRVEVRMLASLGVDPLRIAQVSYMGPAEDGLFLYDGTVFVVGDVLRYRYQEEKSGVLLPVAYHGVTLCVRKDPRSFYNMEGLPERAIQLDCFLRLPWVLTNRAPE